MDDLFIIRDPDAHYTVDQILSILKTAESQGFPLDKGSYLEHMTVRQLARLTHGVYDA